MGGSKKSLKFPRTAPTATHHPLLCYFPASKMDAMGRVFSHSFLIFGSEAHEDISHWHNLIHLPIPGFKEDWKSEFSGSHQKEVLTMWEIIKICSKLIEMAMDASE